MTPPRLTTLNTQLLVIDLQEKLLGKMPQSPELLRDVGFLLEVANLLGVPSLATEQYPRGLGPTHPDLLRHLAGERPAKVAFSCCGAPGVLSELRQRQRPGVVLLGVETHVCVLNTALDLLAESFQVFLPVDALRSRHALDHQTALDRMQRAGCVPTTVETVAFEWLAGADHPHFKAVSRLIQQRTA